MQQLCNSSCVKIELDASLTLRKAACSSIVQMRSKLCVRLMHFAQYTRMTAPTKYIISLLLEAADRAVCCDLREEGPSVTLRPRSHLGGLGELCPAPVLVDDHKPYHRHRLRLIDFLQ